jgi:hypothetical protein
MSHTETHFGKLRKVEIPENHLVEDWCREKCRDLGYTEMATYNSTWEEQLRCETYDKYFFADGEVWEAVEHIESEDGDDIDIMVKNPDGTITFVQQFYNGGTCLSEVIEEGLAKLKKPNT